MERIIKALRLKFLEKQGKGDTRRSFCERRRLHGVERHAGWSFLMTPAKESVKGLVDTSLEGFQQ